MLSDAEHRELLRIESRLRVEDPRFVKRFEAGPRRGRRWRRPRVVWAAVIAAVAVLATAMFLGVVHVTAHAFGATRVGLVWMGAAWWGLDPGLATYVRPEDRRRFGSPTQ